MTIRDSGAGFEATLEDSTLGAPLPPATAVPASLPHYAIGAELGRGGMGDVVLAKDPTIGRDVAIKRMRATAPTDEQVQRFLREARIQARLEHPAIVPVYELGRDANDQPFFAMKRITGVTLAESLAAAPPPPRPRLLRVFADVCRALELAHVRGVVHRDLKPANIMLGAYGEVYVLDWGLARVTAAADTTATPETSGTIAMRADLGSLDDLDSDATQAGALLGTPGYMAPEQAEARAPVTQAADVYALGAILFEILAGEPLHPKGVAAAITSTMTLAPEATAPGARRPDREIAPELDALCRAALARDPHARATARELAERVEGYLDGDRDLEQRRRLAAAELALARARLATGDATDRAAAMQHAGRALAIAPTDAAAIDLVRELMFAPPASHPPALVAELHALDAAQQQRQSRVARGSFVAIFAFLAMAAVDGIASWPYAGLLVALTAALMALAWRLSLRPATTAEMLLTVVGNAVLVGVLSRTYGPLVLAPGVVCVMALSLTSYPQLIERVWLVIGLLVASWLVPIALEWLRVLPATWSVDHDRITSSSGLVHIGHVSTTILLVVANILTFATIGLFANALARTRRDAQHAVAAQAWHIRQFLPVAATRR